MANKKTVSAQMDAIALLMNDHKRVKGLFEEFKKFEDSPEGEFDDLKQELIDSACAELKIHAQVEEEIFYPAVRRALPDEDALLNEADVEHAGAKDLIAQVEDGSADDPMTCARFTVLAEYIEHHVKEEETDMFPKVRKAHMNLGALGKSMAERKEELKAEMGVTPCDEVPDFASNGAEKRASLWERITSATTPRVSR